MLNQKGFSKVAIIIIVLILIGGAYFVFSRKDRSVSIQDVKNWAEETPNMALLVNFGRNLDISDNVVSVYIEKGTSITDLDTETGKENLFNNLLINPEYIKDEKIGKEGYKAKKITIKNESSGIDFVKYLVDHSGLLYQIIYRRNTSNIISASEFNQMLSTFKFIK